MNNLIASSFYYNSTPRAFDQAKKAFYIYEVINLTDSKINEEAHLRDLVSRESDNVQAWANLGKVLNIKNDFIGAAEALSTALELKPDDEWILFEYGYALSMQDDFDKAEMVYRKLLTTKPNQISIWYNLALILNKKQDWEATRETYLKIIELEPNDKHSWLNYGVLLNRLGEFEEAEKAFRKALAIDSKYTKAALNLGLLLEEDLKKVSAAAEVYKQSFAENPYCILLLVHYYRAIGNNRYLPTIIDAQPKKDFSFEGFKAVVVDEIDSIGKIEYDYLLLLYDDKSSEPLFYVSLERNSLFIELGPPSHFLCGFDETGHQNYGGFEEETNLDNFTKKALEIVGNKYKIAKEKLHLK